MRRDCFDARWHPFRKDCAKTFLNLDLLLSKLVWGYVNVGVVFLIFVDLVYIDNKWCGSL